MKHTSENRLLTYAGRQFYPMDPCPDDICIGDIAHGLANLCRFSGQAEDLYSVAEHSCLITEHAPPSFRKWALPHDSTEGYVAPSRRTRAGATNWKRYRGWGSSRRALPDHRPQAVPRIVGDVPMRTCCPPCSALGPIHAGSRLICEACGYEVSRRLPCANRDGQGFRRHAVNQNPKRAVERRAPPASVL
jgi:hypothetical protein